MQILIPREHGFVSKMQTLIPVNNSEFTVFVHLLKGTYSYVIALKCQAANALEQMYEK